MTTVQAEASLRHLSVEITGQCQFTCPSVCYAGSGPTRGHGTMSDDDWLRTIDQALALGVREVQVIGGEPTRHPSFVRIVRHAVDAGLRVRVYTNLFRVGEQQWELFADPAVRLATTYHSRDAAEHDAVTGRAAGSHAATRANIIEAVRRRIALRVSVLVSGGSGRAKEACAELRGLGLSDVHLGAVRPVGNAGPLVLALCGRCADGRAVVLPNGDVAACEIGRFLTGGNVREEELRAVLSGDRWADASARVPRRPDVMACGPGDCEPASSDSCGPAKSEPCGPMGFAPPSADLTR
ncbi:radical SAM protein [Streptomyces sp. NPDC048659]|uniref:radical SAM protein n=1 Tax=Streptomyces sp. NPDC048659 TaxID=3155489 RepID=UPI003414C1A7